MQNHQVNVNDRDREKTDKKTERDRQRKEGRQTEIGTERDGERERKGVGRRNRNFLNLLLHFCWAGADTPPTQRRAESASKCE